jgi:MFS transporter, DHA1 family, multidrug resistance protein
MADETASSIATDSPSDSSTLAQVLVLGALASAGTLSTNILLPSLPAMASSLNVSSAAVTSAITVFLVVFAVGQLVVGPISDRVGRRWPVLIGFAVFLIGSLWGGLATDLPYLLVGRVIQSAGACATSVLTRAIARDLFSGEALGRAMALIMIAMAAALGFSPLLGGVLEYCFGWRAEFAFVAVFAAVSLIAYDQILGETHHATRVALNARATVKTYLGLSVDRAFVVPASSVGLILAGLFALLSAAPRALIEGLHFSAIQLGLFFAGLVLVVSTAGALATKLAARFGLVPSIQGGLLVAAAGGLATLLVSCISPSFFPFLLSVCVFILGMGIVNPLGSALTLSPFGDKAGAASALLGFWQSITAAIAVWLAATVSDQAMFALGMVLTGSTLLTLAIFPMRARN